MKKTTLFLLTLLLTFVGALGLSAQTKEAYLLFDLYPTNSTITVTFYYDDQASEREDPFENRLWPVTDNGQPLTMPQSQDGYEKLVITFDPSFADYRPTNTSYWFSSGLDSYTVNHVYFENMQYLNTSMVTNMSHMFDNATGFSGIECPDLSHFDTSKVTDMSYMFKSCHPMHLDLSSFTFNPSANFTGMFEGFSVMESLTLPASANYLPNDAFSSIVEREYLEWYVKLFLPNGTVPQGATQGNGYIQWKGGYFLWDGVLPEAYAVLSTDKKTLTFYCDNSRSNKTGTTFDLNTGSNLPGWYSSRSSVEKVVFDSSFENARPTNCFDWFYQMSALKSIDGIKYLRTDQVTNMSFMFSGCSGLKSLDLSGFNTSNTTDMESMFEGCSGLTSLDLRGFNTSSVRHMEFMFQNCSGLKTIDVSHFDTSKVTGMSYMFHNCSQLVSLDLSSFNIKNFYTAGMMKDCSGLRTVTIPSTANILVNDAFSGVGSATNPCTLIYPEGFDLQKDQDFGSYFTWKGGCFKGTAPMPEAYALMPTGDATTLTFYYDALKDSRRGISFDLNTDDNIPEWYQYEYNKQIESVIFDSSFAKARPTSCFYWFYGMNSLTSIIGMEDYLKTDDVTNMSHMFQDCYQLESLDVSNFNTANVTSMSYMFANCLSLKGLDVSNFNTAKVINMHYMFSYCASLTNLDLSNFNTAKVRAMSNMFEGCSRMTGLDLSSFTFKESTLPLYFSDFLKNTQLQTLIIPSSAYNLASDAFSGVGTAENPCTLIYPDGFNLQKDEVHDTYFVWKGGYFKEATKEAYAVLSTDMKTLTFYYDKRRDLHIGEGTAYETNTGTEAPEWYMIVSSVTKVVFDPSFAEARPTSCSFWFMGMTDLTDIEGLQYLNTSEAISMLCTFLGCSSLTELDLSSFTFNESSATPYMFSGCSKLSKLTVPETAAYLHKSAFDATTAIPCVGTPENPCTLIYPAGMELVKDEETDTYFKWKGGYFKMPPTEAYTVLDGSTLTFYYDNLKESRSGTKYELNTGTTTPEWNENSSAVETVVFDTSFAGARPTSCSSWFDGMESLKSITGIKNLKTDDVTNMSSMFYGCSDLASLDLSGFNTANVTNMAGMFYGCSGLKSLDLSSFTFREGANTIYMFKSCSGLTQLTIPSSANTLNDYACEGVGIENPCVLIYPKDMELDKTPGNDDTYFVYKGGYFTDLLPGDTNGDKTVTVADVMLTVNKVLGRELSTFNPKAADVNKDGVITVSDVMGIVNIVLSGGRASAPRNAYQTMSDAMGMTAKGNELTLHLRGTGSYTASQMIITLPEGCRLENAQMVSSRSNGHSVQTSDLGNGQYRVVVYGASGLPFGSSCSDLVRLNVKGNHNGNIAVSDIQVVDHLTNTFLLSDVSGIATDIDSIGSDASDDGDWYTTQGQKVATPTRGVYIRNGRKVVVR